jgi:general stress protein 26
MRNKEFLQSQKVLRLATIDPSGNPHIIPVWYMYYNNKFYIGTNTKTRKAKNIKENSKVSFCIDIGIKSPDIFGIMGIGRAKLIIKTEKVNSLAEKILLRYFKTLKNQSAQQLLNQTDCVIEITPKKITNWKY